MIRAYRGVFVAAVVLGAGTWALAEAESVAPTPVAAAAVPAVAPEAVPPVSPVEGVEKTAVAAAGCDNCSKSECYARCGSNNCLNVRSNGCFGGLAACIYECASGEVHTVVCNKPCDSGGGGGGSPIFRKQEQTEPPTP